MAERLFRDRREAGRVLAGLLERYRGRPDVVILGLLRGGVPVAYQVAMALSAPLDVFLARKLGIPGHEEVAMGAIASGGTLVLVVDDGLATGASMRAAVLALRQQRPARIVVAVPAAPESTCREREALVDEISCTTTPSPFLAVGQSYWDFTQTTDEEVRDLLRTQRLIERTAGWDRGDAPETYPLAV